MVSLRNDSLRSAYSRITYAISTLLFLEEIKGLEIIKGLGIAQILPLTGNRL